MKNYLYESREEWSEDFICFVSRFAIGLWKTFCCLFFGIVSVVVWLWKCAVNAVERFPNIALGGFIVVTGIVWVLTFASMRAKAVGAEAERDSISWEYLHFKETHGYKD